jgi:hypothetical protein
MASNTTSATPTASDAPPTFKLIVIHPFAKYRRGTEIADASAIATVLAGENAHHCVRVAI